MIILILCFIYIYIYIYTYIHGFLRVARASRERVTQGFQGYGLSILRIRYLAPRMLFGVVVSCLAILRIEGCLLQVARAPRERGTTSSVESTLFCCARGFEIRPVLSRLDNVIHKSFFTWFSLWEKRQMLLGTRHAPQDIRGGNKYQNPDILGF